MDIQYICNLIENRKEELFALLSRLVQINSENFGATGREEECARYIHDLCQELGLESDLYSPLDLEGFTDHPDYFPGRNLENRYNVTAVWKGTEDKNELMLMGHIDTVAIGNPDNWSVDPLGGEIKDGKIYGRGANDNKSALALSLFLIKLLKDEGFQPKANLVFSAYSDEELGGSHGALASVLKYPCNRIVNLDGDVGQLWHCSSGGQVISYRYHTRETVDSAELTASAIPVILEEMKKFGENRRKELEANPFYQGTVFPKASLRYNEVRAGDNGADVDSGLVQFTFYTDKTKAEIDRELETIKETLDTRLAPLGMVGDGFSDDTRFFHYVYTEPDCQHIREFVAAAEEAIGKAPAVCGSCLSDLSVILKYGSPYAFNFGPCRDFGEIGGAHQPDEFVSCDALLEAAKTVAAYILKVLG